MPPGNTAWPAKGPGSSGPTGQAAAAAASPGPARGLRVGVAAIATTMLLACGGDRGTGPDAPAAAAHPALTVTTARPERRELVQEIAATGDIAAWQEASVSSEEGGLRVIELLADVGDTVTQGQVLVRFDAASVRQDEAQARASVAEAEAALAEAAADADRARKLDGSGAFSQQETQRYRIAEQSARARLGVARAALGAQSIRLRRTRLLAPDAGVISVRSATLGQVVQPGAELFRLVRGGRLEWRAEVMAEQLPRIEPGQAVRVQLPAVPGAPAAEVTGTVRQVAPTLDAQKRQAIVYVDLPADSPARAGMFARGKVQVGASAALTVPQAAVVLRDGLPHVLVLQDGQRVRLDRVETGRLVDGRMEIVQGLAADASVVVRGAAFLGDGDTVRVVDEPPAGTAGDTAGAPS